MFDTLLGLPAHPFFVHFAVAAVPVAALLTAVAGWLPTNRLRSLAVPLVVLDALALVAAFVAKESGEALEHMLPREPLIETHAELGDVLPAFPGLLLLASLGLWWVSRRRADRSGPKIAIAALATILAVVACWWTFRVGHTGAEAVWHDAPLNQSTQAPAGSD